VRLRPALLLVLLLGSADAAPAQPPTTERPVYAPGQRWVRNDGVFELVRVEKDRYVFATGPLHEVHLTKDLAIARTRNGPRFNEIDPPIALKWPLEVGRWGIQNSIWRWTDKPNGVPARLIWRVAAYENVRVPAGAFEAFRIEMQVELSASWNKTFTAWYAPAVRQYVKGGPGGMFNLDTFSVVSVDAPRPLRIALAQPAEAAQVGSAEVRLTGKVSGDALARVEIALNGTEVTRLAAERAEPIVLDVPLRLQPGKNTILVTAVDRNGERRQDSRIVHRFRAEPPKAAAPSAAPRPAAASAVTIAVSAPAHRSTVEHLIPTDADPDDLFSTALPMDDLQTIFGRIEAERVVAFLDACYSGAAGGRTFSSKKTRAGAVDDLFLERLTRSKGRAIVTASRPAEVSIELPELGHGIFSYYLVNGLKGAGDLNRDGIVSLQELYEYVEQQVTAKSRAVGGNQHPVMKGELEGVLPLTKVKGP
jgi:hypothetical protein